jgi:hypothetical protein
VYGHALAFYLYGLGLAISQPVFFALMGETTTKQPRFSLIDWLLLVGITAIVGGVAGFSVFAALIVLGVLLLVTAYGLSRSQTGKEGKV